MGSHAAFWSRDEIHTSLSSEKKVKGGGSADDCLGGDQTWVVDI